MSQNLDLRALERKAFRSIYQDGLWDITLGLIVIGMAIFVFRPEEGYSAFNFLWMMVIFSAANLIFWAGKKFITVPRMGQVRFGEIRKQKSRTLALIMAVFVLIQGGVVLLTAFGWRNPELGAKISSILNAGNMERLAVATVGSLFVGPSFILIAYFSDFLRGYYIAILMSLAVFLMILLNQPIYPMILGGLIAVPGVVLFVQFLRQHPLPSQEAHHGNS
ncbi:MAG TPA: hypothetical protein VLA72_21305 [Anaerolineales bacterium]|nr:hypothetical protein [Anaerolineales bacterium]